MKRNLFVLMSLIVLGSMILAACGGAAPATEPPAPAATEPPSLPRKLRRQPKAPAATEAPAAAPSGTATITFVQEPDNLNPMYTTMSFSGYFAPLLFEAGVGF